MTCCSTLKVVSFSRAEMYCDNLISGTEEADESFPPIFEIFERSGCTLDARSKGRKSCSKRLYKSFTSWDAQEITPLEAYKRIEIDQFVSAREMALFVRHNEQLYKKIWPRF